MANLAIRIYAAESLQYRTAFYLEDALGELDESSDTNLIAGRMREYAVETAICKVYGSETLDYVADESLQLHGGYGFIKEYKVEQVYRDWRITAFSKARTKSTDCSFQWLFCNKRGKEWFHYRS